MSSIGDLVANLGMNTSGFAAGAQRAQSISSSMAAGISSALGPIAASFAGAFALGSAITGAKEAFASEAKLAAVLAATGHAAELSTGQIKTFAAQLQQTTNFEDDATVAAAAMLASFTNIKGDNFKRVLTDAADFATVMETDLPSAVKLFGKALNDPAEGITKLKKAGVQFTDAQEAQIKALQKSGDMMGAQDVILSSLEGRFKGAAAAVADPFKQLQNNIGDIGEQIGGAMLPLLNALATATSNWIIPASAMVQQYSGILSGAVQVTIAAVAAFVAIKVAAFAYAVAQNIASASAITFQAILNPATLVKIAIGIAGAAVAIRVMNDSMASANAAAGTGKSATQGYANSVGQLGDEADDAATKVAKLTSIQRENQSLANFVAAGGDEKKAKRLEFAQDPKTTDWDLGSFDYLDARAEALKRMTEATEKQAKAQEALFAKDNEAIKNAKAMKDQIAVLTGSMTKQEAAQRALERQGFTPEQAEFQAQLETQKEKLKADQDAAKTTAALKDEIDVLTGAMSKEEAMRKALVRSGLTEEQAAEQARLETEKSNLEEEENAIKKQDTKDKKLNDRISLKASLAGSQEAASILTRGLGGGKNDIEKNQLTTLKQIATLTAQNKPPAAVAANF